jgi:hypothetical protein
MQKARPPIGLKTPSLLLSWELYTKHLIRQVAREGTLKLLIPIGMEVELAITRRRMEQAVSICAGTEVADTFPAPNAWIPGECFGLESKSYIFITHVSILFSNFQEDMDPFMPSLLNW